MTKEIKSYILFPSHTDGLALEGVLKTKKIKYTIVPTPRELSKCCGISIMISTEDTDSVIELMQSFPDIKTDGIHTIEKKKRNWFQEG